MLLSKLHIRKLFPPWNCNLTKSWIKLKHKLTTNFNATLHYLNLFRIIIITNFTFFVFNNLVFWFCIALCFVLWSAIFSCTKYFLDKNLSRNKLRQKLAFEVVIIQIFCNIMNIKWLPLKQSFCFLYAYRRTMTRMTKRTRRPMTTPMTEAMDTGSENKKIITN